MKQRIYKSIISEPYKSMMVLFYYRSEISLTYLNGITLMQHLQSVADSSLPKLQGKCFRER